MSLEVEEEIVASLEKHELQNAIWITWEVQRRNISLSTALGVRYIELNLNLHRLLRYPLLVMLTLLKILWYRPSIIFSQNPSIVLASLCVLIGKVFRIKVVVDAHNSGVFPFEGRKKWANSLATLLFKKATITIVSNGALRDYVEQKGGVAFVLPDPVPEIVDSDDVRIDLPEKYNALFICTWAQDEPYFEVIKAGNLLGEHYCIHITGNSKGRERALPGGLPDNIRLTGFVSDDVFIAYLSRCDVIIDLTTREDCLVCGAYEAVAAAQPLILSDTKALREYFDRGSIYVDNTSEGIADAIRKAERNQEKLKNEIVELKKIRCDSWNTMKLNLIATLANI